MSFRLLVRRSAPRAARIVFVLLAAAFACARPAAAEPFLFPETPDGGPEVRDALDVAPYLASWKSAGLARSRALATPATANQQAYDVHYYDLDLTMTPGSGQVSGTVRMKASVVSGPLTTAELDLASNLIVDGVTSNGSAATSSRPPDLVTVNLDRAYLTGETFDITVTYHGSPVGGSFGFQNVNGRMLIWSLSEPFGAREWWPCKDMPEDKADSLDARFTVPTGLITASNGTRIEATDNGTVAVSRWRERYPIATYLVSIASYPYAVSLDWYRPAPTDSMPIQFFNFPESVANATPSQVKVKDMLAAFAARFGEYPFLAEKYGHAEFTFGGGMEHQTCTSLGTYNESVVAHELGHQWFGDRVTCRDFHHIWLNEGFATYSEALWSEASGGTAAYFADINIGKFYGAGTIHVPDVGDVNRIFDSNLSYNKGAWVLHMLRHVLGDAAFFAALQQYAIQYGYSTAVTEDFRDVCEAVSGRDLDAYFQQWIYGEYYPAYRFAWTSEPVAGGYDVTLTLDQTQSWGLFTMPVDVRVTTLAGDVTFVVPDSLASQTFTLHVTDPPTEVALDPDGWILKTVEAPVVNPSFVKPILLVNGVDWATYGSEILSSYTSKAFWGDYPIDFWDHFQAPGVGYPGTLPAPLGHGPVPASVIGNYRCVVWVGNNFNGDLASWFDTPILSYLKSGGNVLLMTRMGDQFLGDSLRNYLGINLVSGTTTILDCTSARPGLTNIGLNGAQTLNVVFDSVRTRSDTQLLYKGVSFNPDRGIGVVREPVAGAGRRPKGGRMIFLSGRPYRWNNTALRNNVMTMISRYFSEPLGAVAVDEVPRASGAVELSAAVPNPFSASTTLRLSLPRAGTARLEVFDTGGRRVKTLFAGRLTAGAHAFEWDGRNDLGRSSGVGIYWALVSTDQGTMARKLIRIR